MSKRPLQDAQPIVCFMTDNVGNVRRSRSECPYG